MEYTLEFLQEKYGEEIGNWVFETMEEMKSLNGDDCIFNERYYDMDSEDSCEYDAMVESWCYEFEVEEIVCPFNGHVFKLGFNFGQYYEGE